jgi:hypothetical protein
MSQARFSDNDQFVLLDYWSKVGCACRRTSNLQEPLFANESSYRPSEFVGGNKLLLQCPDNSWEIREFAKISEPGVKIEASNDKRLERINSSVHYSHQEKKLTTFLFLMLTDGTCEIRTLNQPTVSGTVIQATNGSRIDWISCSDDSITLFTAQGKEIRNINALTQPGTIGAIPSQCQRVSNGSLFTAFQHANDGTKHANLWEIRLDNRADKPGIIIKNSELVKDILESQVPNTLEFSFHGENPKIELRAQDNPNMAILATINEQTIKAILHFKDSTAFKLNDGSWEIRKTDTILEPGIRLQSNFWKSVTEISQYCIGSQDHFTLIHNDATLTLAKQKNDLSPRQLLVAAIFEELSRSYTGQQILKTVEEELITWFKAYPQSSSVRGYIMSFFSGERSTQQSTSSSSRASSSTSAYGSTTTTNTSVSATVSASVTSTPEQTPTTASAQNSMLKSIAATFLSWVNTVNPLGN